MANQADVTNLEEVLDRIKQASEGESEVSVRMIVEAVGGRSFGPMLLVPGLILVAPGVGDIPGVTTLCAIFVLIVSGQLLFQRKHLWLPRWLLDRSVERKRINKLIGWLNRPARWIDRLIHRRLTKFSSVMAIAIGCTAVALFMPLMEVVPLGGILVGAALGAYGLALIAQDGLLAIIAYLATAAALGAAIYFML